MIVCHCRGADIDAAPQITLASGWGFSVVQDGNNLNLLYSQQVGPEPEPGTRDAAALLLGGAAFARWRKRAKSA